MCAIIHKLINSYLEYYYSSLNKPIVHTSQSNTLAWNLATYLCSRILLFKNMRFRYYILGLLATTFAFSLQLNKEPDSFDLSNGRSLEDMDLEDGWKDSEKRWVIYAPDQACSCFVSRVTKSDLRGVTPLSKRAIGRVPLNTACWQTSKTYTMTPLQGVVVSIFLQPTGSTSTYGNIISWAVENALNVAIRVLIAYTLPDNGGPSATTLDVEPGVITSTRNWQFPVGATNFQLAARTLP